MRKPNTDSLTASNPGRPSVSRSAANSRAASCRGDIQSVKARSPECLTVLDGNRCLRRGGWFRSPESCRAPSAGLYSRPYRFIQGFRSGRKSPYPTIGRETGVDTTTGADSSHANSHPDRDHGSHGVIERPSPDIGANQYAHPVIPSNRHSHTGACAAANRHADARPNGDTDAALNSHANGYADPH